MLFEVFFNRDAKLRAEIKGDQFNKLFNLEKHKELRASFQFIAEALAASRGEFYAIPGLGHGLAVTVTTTEDAGYHRVDSIYVNGTNVLRPQDADWAEDDLAKRRYRPKSIADFEEQLSQDLVVPSRLLKITYAPPDAANGELKVPLGYGVRKR
jgi:hypothetical protein